MNREWVRAVANEAAEGGSTGLPPVTADDNGKILGVVNGAWGAMDAGGGGSSNLEELTVTVDTENTSIVITETAAEIEAIITQGKQPVIEFTAGIIASLTGGESWKKPTAATYYAVQWIDDGTGTFSEPGDLMGIKFYMGPLPYFEDGAASFAQFMEFYTNDYSADPLAYNYGE